MALITVFGIVVFRYIFIAEADSNSNSSCFPVPVQNDMCKAINISCPQGSVIYKPNIEASSDECPASGENFQNSGSPCVGRPGDLEADIADCFWKQSCLIQFPLQPIYTRKCINVAQSIIVHDWICIKAEQTSVYFKELICKSQYIGRHAKSGVILSHQHIPWNYDRTMFDDNLNKLQILKPEETCETTIIVPTAGGSRVLVEINLFDIDIQNDQLTINEIMVDKEDFHKEFPPNTQVNIKFSSKTDKSKSGKGFVICFRRLNEQEKNDKSACDGIFELGKDPKLTFDKDIQLEHGTITDSTTVYTTPMSQTFKSTPSTDQQCIKCLERKRPNEKCKKLCCIGQVTHPQCQNQASPTTTTTPTQGKCKVKKKRIDKFCKNCVKGKINCGKKDNCYSCCPGKTISPKCRNRNKDRKRKRKDRKKKKPKKKKDKKGS
ncbi:uncharacterized protein LOC127703815 isoform X2 [Mytilus californianus]|uniref:uncharacterized protein LOC127703815 isoform X2 n=1 Tax=Mytilus californianus TaxID=6549 RepID=UPI0022455159|nr:uncharacterized protein LOC127703815 isoform X2 [Mytilus californianus]